MGQSSTVLGAFGGITTAYGQYAAGRMNASTLRYNAKISELQGKDALARGKAAEIRQRQDTAGLIGAQRAAAAAQGIDVNTGTAAQLQEQAAYRGELDALTIRNNAAREAFGYKIAAVNDRNQALMAKLGGDTAAAGTILSTASDSTKSYSANK